VVAVITFVSFWNRLCDTAKRRSGSASAERVVADTNMCFVVQPDSGSTKTTNNICSIVLWTGRVFGVDGGRHVVLGVALGEAGLRGGVDCLWG
jgi:hypothetical protein